MKSCVTAALGILLSAAVASAQSTRLTIDLSGARMRFADTLDASAVSVAPELGITARRASLTAAGMVSRLDGATTTSGVLDGSLFPAGRGRYTTEIGLRAGGSHHSDGARTGELLAAARFHATAIGKGAWLGAGAGRTWDGTWRRILRGDAGGWVANGAQFWALVANPTAVDDTIRYVDALLSFDQENDRVNFSASLGARAGDRVPNLPANRKVWGGLSVAYWMTPSTAIVANAGSYPVDFTQGYPGGRYVSLGLRFSPRRLTSLTPNPPHEPPSTAVRGFQTDLLDSGVQLRVLAPDALKVEISGDFTGWDPVALQRGAEGWWAVVVSLPPGIHQMNVRVDGGSWLVPPGLTAITDEFGVVSGLLVIER